MLCQNCKKNEANVKYTQVINGEKKQMILCEECSKLLGIDNINFNMPIEFSNFFGDFLDEYDSDFIPMIAKPKELECGSCNMTYNEFMNTGKFGCSNCYKEFESKISSLLKRIHGTDEYKGRRVKENKKIIKSTQKEEMEDVKNSNKEELEKELKQAIKEERYEDAAKIRDEIKKEK